MTGWVFRRLVWETQEPSRPWLGLERTDRFGVWEYLASAWGASELWWGACPPFLPGPEPSCGS